ncbi:hypothetical protein BC628DRAFT_222916 [Trametes gibbosa]|nr:hypothetical protein BC628DRAFT_222916 [Trametes gibbosa]
MFHCRHLTVHQADRRSRSPPVQRVSAQRSSNIFHPTDARHALAGATDWIPVKSASVCSSVDSTFPLANPRPTSGPSSSDRRRRRSTTVGILDPRAPGGFWRPPSGAFMRSGHQFIVHLSISCRAVPSTHSGSCAGHLCTELTTVPQAVCSPRGHALSTSTRSSGCAPCSSSVLPGLVTVAASAWQQHATCYYLRASSGSSQVRSWLIRHDTVKIVRISSPSIASLSASVAACVHACGSRSRNDTFAAPKAHHTRSGKPTVRPSYLT